MCNNPIVYVYCRDWSRYRRTVPLPFNRKNCNESITDFVLDGAVRDFKCFMTLEQFEAYKWFFDRYAKVFEVYRIPCRKCLGCKMDRKNEWSLRCMIESMEYDSNQFITFTYRDEDVPFSLRRKHWQDFMKRLRRWCEKNGRPSPRQYYRGEYGSKYGRPHFHAILFNLAPFEDAEIIYWLTSRGKKVYHAIPGAVPHYTSRTLEAIWTHGFVDVAKVCLESIKYVANYLDKGYRLGKINFETGEVQCAPFNGMSRRPAIGRAFVNRKILGHSDELFTVNVPRVPTKKCTYFRRMLKELLPDEYEELKHENAAIAAGQPKPWERTTLSEFEYLQQREERMLDACRKFGKEDPFLSS